MKPVILDDRDGGLGDWSHVKDLNLRDPILLASLSDHFSFEFFSSNLLIAFNTSLVKKSAKRKEVLPRILMRNLKKSIPNV